jgi:hypothetical protein
MDRRTFMQNYEEVSTDQGFTFLDELGQLARPEKPSEASQAKSSAKLLGVYVGLNLVGALLGTGVTVLPTRYHTPGSEDHIALTAALKPFKTIYAPLVGIKVEYGAVIIKAAIDVGKIPLSTIPEYFDWMCRQALQFGRFAATPPGMPRPLVVVQGAATFLRSSNAKEFTDHFAKSCLRVPIQHIMTLPWVVDLEAETVYKACWFGMASGYGRWYALNSKTILPRLLRCQPRRPEGPPVVNYRPTDVTSPVVLPPELTGNIELK